MRKRQDIDRGGAMLEFCLLIPVWVPLLLGTLFVGSAMVRGQQVTQVARDLASMFCRGIDFSAGAASNAILTQVTQELGTLDSASGTGVIIFSTLTYVGNSVCASAGAAYHDNSTPPQHTAACTNYGKFVFTQRYTQGNSSLRTSNFGSPASADLDSTNKYRIDSIATYVTNTADVANFKLLPNPLENGTDGYQSGQPVYVVEVFFSGTGQIGYTQGGSYAYAAF